MKLKVCIAGATGWVGKPLGDAVAKAEDMDLVGAVSPSNKGRRLGDIIDNPSLSLTISGTVNEALQVPTDVFVDYTRADAVKANVMTAVDRGVHVVIGSSGLNDQDFADIDRIALAKKVGVIASGNFAISAVLLQRFACEAAKYISQWEIVDYASDTKPDAPSGTANELAFRLSEVRKPEVTHTIEEIIGQKESRGLTLNGIQIHSIRLPSYVIGVEAVFGGKDERLTIRHDAGTGAAPYIQGTLLAIRKVRSHVGVIRGLDRIMD